ncbi:MAG: hypothetical protein HY326_04270 [Chloroflexi bacterium]|nr:hypothetical protein [Chloroflexota bacterium]
MLSIKGTFQDGVARPVDPIEGREGQQVIITFLEEKDANSAAQDEADWDKLMQLIDDCTVETGISDLAHQHDHYLHGKPHDAHADSKFV